MLKSTFSRLDDIILVVTKTEVNTPKMIVAIKWLANLSLSAKIVSNPKARVLQVPKIVKDLSIVNSLIDASYQNFIKKSKMGEQNQKSCGVIGFMESKPVFMEE